jgi:hypothetical protein
VIEKRKGIDVKPIFKKDTIERWECILNDDFMKKHKRMKNDVLKKLKEIKDD